MHFLFNYCCPVFKTECHTAVCEKTKYVTGLQSRQRQVKLFVIVELNYLLCYQIISDSLKQHDYYMIHSLIFFIENKN